jgi:hypothetical protein
MRVEYAPDPGTAFRVIGRPTAIVLDCREPAAPARFWAEALGSAVRPYGEAEVVAVEAPDGSVTLFSARRCPGLERPTTVCISTSGRRRPLSGALVGARGDGPGVPPEWTVLADPEGNEFCVSRPATA